MKQLQLLFLFVLVAVGLSIAQNQQPSTTPAGVPQFPGALATATVQFEVPSQPPVSVNGSRGLGILGAAPAPPIPPELHNDGDIKLPLRGSPLPLLSLIGFGLLIGGAAHALRTPKGPTRRAVL